MGEQKCSHLYIPNYFVATVNLFFKSECSWCIISAGNVFSEVLLFLSNSFLYEIELLVIFKKITKSGNILATAAFYQFWIHGS